jgi:hypothetical protein
MDESLSFYAGSQKRIQEKPPTLLATERGEKSPDVVVFQQQV